MKTRFPILAAAFVFVATGVQTACAYPLSDISVINRTTGERLKTYRHKGQLWVAGKPGERSDILDALFIQDAEECLARMHEALDALPIDVYAIELEAAELFRHAEQIEMWGIYHQARQLQNFVLQLSDANESTQDQAIQDIVQHLSSIEQTLRAVDC